MSLRLSREERGMLEGEAGPAAALAMRVIVRLAVGLGARRLRPVTSAHIDGGLYHGRAGLDFANRLVQLGGRVRVPSTLNVGSLDLLHPGLVRMPPAAKEAARRLMVAYRRLGCRPTWTCAPYQLPHRPGRGEHVAWAESNAIVFANSVLGARTDRYGDFADICAAIVGRVPDAGLHLDRNRRGGLVFDLSGVSARIVAADSFLPLLGHLIGRRTGDRVPVIFGLPQGVSEDGLKALGAAAASSGGVALFHAVGVTPEAPTLDAALAGRHAPVVRVSMDDLRHARRELSTLEDGPIDAVSVGTPHLSLQEFDRLRALTRDLGAPAVPFYASSNRAVLWELRRRGWLGELEAWGVVLVVDTCTYVAPILPPDIRVVMTNSAKWAYYAPANLGVGVVFGSLSECVRSAAAGRVVREDGDVSG